MFESAVMDGAPIFSLFRGPLPAIELRGFTGILNSCTNLLLGSDGGREDLRRSRQLRAINWHHRNRSFC